jgi:hypothetical protein
MQLFGGQPAALSTTPANFAKGMEFMHFFLPNLQQIKVLRTKKRKMVEK